MPTKTKLDAKDRTILIALKGNARIPKADLARMVGLSEGAIRGRIAWLENYGAIRGYCALIRPGLVERAPLVWATFSIVAADAGGQSRFEQGLRASACVDQLDRMMTPSTYVIRAFHEDIVDLITTVALTAGVMVRDVNSMRVETPVGIPTPTYEQSPSRPPPRSGTATQTGYKSRS